MSALYRGETVRVVRVDGRHTLIVWRGKLRRVQARDLEADTGSAEHRTQSGGALNRSNVLRSNAQEML